MIFVTQAYADENSSVKTHGSCNLTLRVIKAINKDNSSAEKTVMSGDYLADLSEQLSPLPYKRFTTISAEERTLMEGEEINFAIDKDEPKTSLYLALSDIYCHGAEMMIDWTKGPEKTCIFASKLRLLNDKNWVVAAENEDGSSTIISLKVKCVSNNDQ